MWYKVNKLIAAIRGVPTGVNLPSPPTHQTKYSIEEAVAKMIQSMSMAWGFRVPVYPKISATSTALAVLNNLTRNPYAAGLAMDGEDGGTGAAYNVSMDHMGHPIASIVRDAYLNLVKIGRQNEIPIFAGGGIGKNGNLAANAASLIMLGASGVQVGKYIMQATAGCLGSERDRCNICNIGLCPKGITSQDSRLYRRLDPEKVAERLVRRRGQFRYGIEEDCGAARSFHFASDRHVRCPRDRRQECGGASRNPPRHLRNKGKE